MRKLLYWLSVAAAAVLLLLFAVFCIIDTVQYDAITNSAPLRVFYLVRAVEFALPAALCGSAAWLLKGNIKSSKES